MALRTHSEPPPAVSRAATLADMPVAIEIENHRNRYLSTREALASYEAARLATLATWRVSKDIYNFDDTVFEELWGTPITGDIPVDILRRLPTLCAYVAFPAPRDVQGDGVAHGFFVHLNYHEMTPVLIMALDHGPVDRIDAEHISLGTYPLQLLPGSDLLQSLTTMHQQAQKMQDSEWFSEYNGMVQPETTKPVLEPLLSLTLYLCSASAEMKARDPLRGLRQKPIIKKTKDGVRMFPPEQPQIWDVAFRIGATLRAAAAATATGPSSRDAGGTHASPRPHIRRAHWHSYWTGPMARVGEMQPTAREIVLKWIPPIPVAMGPDDESIPTVHRVTR